ncbi:hypothetical protein KI387_021595, partial [Taxus chinensis]
MRSTRTARISRNQEQTVRKQMGHLGREDVNRPVRPKRRTFALTALGHLGQKYANQPNGRTGRFCSRQFGTCGTKVRARRGSPKELKANQCMPRVIGQMRDEEAHFGRIG